MPDKPEKYFELPQLNLGGTFPGICSSLTRLRGPPEVCVNTLLLFKIDSNQELNISSSPSVDGGGGGEGRGGEEGGGGIFTAVQFPLPDPLCSSQQAVLIQRET